MLTRTCGKYVSIKLFNLVMSCSRRLKSADINLVSGITPHRDERQFKCYSKVKTLAAYVARPYASNRDFLGAGRPHLSRDSDCHLIP